MDNSAQGSSGSTRNALKYVGVEVMIVVIILIAIAVYFLKPFANLNIPPNSSKTSSGMTSSVPVNKTISAQNNKLTAPTVIVTITLSDNGVEPSVASASATGTVIRIMNNTTLPKVIEFSGNLVPSAVIAPTTSWDSPTIVTKGSFKYMVKGTNISGTITFK